MSGDFGDVALSFHNLLPRRQNLRVRVKRPRNHIGLSLGFGRSGGRGLTIAWQRRRKEATAQNSNQRPH
jgi:hypothetical protein